jgi:ABC-type dipeptide/oligopeptide/nickel transport system permease component
MLHLGVLAFLLRRLLLGAVVVVAVSLLSWLVFATALSPIWRFFGTPNSPTVLEIVHRAHLHDPLLVRYWYWAKGLFTGQGLGRTAVDNTPVGSIIWPALATSLELIAGSLVVVVFLSLLVGTVGAQRGRSPVGWGLRGVSYVAWSVPPFLLAVLLQQALARLGTDHRLGLAVGGPPTPGLAFGPHAVVDWFQHMTLPILVVAAGLVGSYSRYVRTAMLVSLNAPYATVARAKGMRERRVVVRHALRNSLAPFTAVVSLDFGALFASSLVADYVFNLRGLASVFIGQVLDISDPFVIQAELVVVAVLVVVVAILGDLVGAWLDPRVSLS